MPPRPLSRVVFDHDRPSAGDHSRFPLVRDRPYVFLGEIADTAGPCVVADHVTGQIHSGYHAESFRELPDDQA